MRSYNRTLLQQMSFADPDKKEPRHDLACQYIAQEPVCPPNDARTKSGSGTWATIGFGEKAGIPVRQVHISTKNERYEKPTLERGNDNV